MAVLLYLLAFSIVVVKYGNGAKFVLLASHPDYPGKCYYKGPPISILQPGQSKRLVEGCLSIRCKINEDKELFLQAIGCGTAYQPPACRKVEGDLSKPYPYCCPEIIC